MSMDWCRLWHDMPTNPKWRAIARRSGQRVSDVIAIYTFMMVCASKNNERGSLEGWDDEDVAAALDLDVESVAAVREAMNGKVIEDGHLSGWDKRQPKREDSSTERVREHRKRRSNAVKRDVTQRNAPDTDTDTEKKVSATSPSKLEESFDRFWAVYPKRVEKQGALRKFEAACRTVDPERIIAGAKIYAQHLRETESLGFCKHPTTWLHNGCWDDEYGVGNNSPGLWSEAAWRGACKAWKRGEGWPENAGDPPDKSTTSVPSEILKELEIYGADHGENEKLGKAPHESRN